MNKIQITITDSKQLDKLLTFLKKLKVEFKFIESDVHDSYKASLKALADDWNDPKNDHWDNI
jgi:hypothetical protein